jgi:predicted Zn finger-like uncharacterized protein
MATSVYFTVSCPSCASEFPVDPDRVPTQGVPAICSTCLRVFRVRVPTGVFRGMSALPLHHEPDESTAEVEIFEELEVVEEVENLEEVEVEVVEEFEFLEEFEVLEEPETVEAELETLEDEDILEDVQILDEVEIVEEVEVIETLETTEVVDSWREEAEAPGAEEETAAGTIEETEELEPKGELDSEPEPEPVSDPEPRPTPSSTSPGGVEREGGVEGKSLSQGIARFGRRDPKDRARRLARVLVSDMITYHPARYEEALENDSLRELFAEEVDKSWREFVDQVGEEMAESTDYFVDALNEILARGRALYRGPGRPR